MDEVTDWVLDKALDQVRDWRALGCTIPVSLNLSSSYLSGATAWEQIRGKLEHRSLPFSMIEIEITEGDAVFGSRGGSCRKHGDGGGG